MEEIEAGAAIHLPLDQFELGDLTLGLSVRPWLGKGRRHRGQVGSDAFPERGQQAGACFCEPAWQRADVARHVDRITRLG